MSPGIPQDTSLLELHADTVLRARWDARDVDHKAVGGHLPLSKRNSTPVGASMAITSSSVAAAAAAAPYAQLLQAHAKASLSPMEAPNLHRRLDRSHSEPSVKGGEGRQANSSRYKTELCRPFQENGFCKYGDKCQFAHGSTEMRSLARHPKYKTELCRTFHTIGFCPYGPRCHFIHNAEERRGASASASGAGTHPPLSPKKLMHLGGGSMGLGSAAETPSPPASLHGSPTSSAGSFFDETFSLFPSKSLLDDKPVGLGSSAFGGGGGLGSPNGYSYGGQGLGGGPGSPSGSSCSGQGLDGGPGSPNGSSSCMGQTLCELDLVLDGNLLALAGIDTPPETPVESLAGDLDSLSMSSSHSSSPTPVTSPQDISRSLRLPIFEQLCEVDKEVFAAGGGCDNSIIVV